MGHVGTGTGLNRPAIRKNLDVADWESPALPDTDMGQNTIAEWPLAQEDMAETAKKQKEREVGKGDNLERQVPNSLSRVPLGLFIDTPSSFQNYYRAIS